MLYLVEVPADRTLCYNELRDVEKRSAIWPLVINNMALFKERTDK